jgi:predicted N-acetyltransferase YhbS
MRHRTTAMVIRDRRYHLRCARLDDVNEIETLEELVWGNMRATREMLFSRIRTFPQGQIVAACDDGHVVGYISIQYVHNLEEGGEQGVRI